MILCSLLYVSCQHSHELKIAEEIEEPNHSIIKILVPLLTNSKNENIKVDLIDFDYADIDSLKNGSVDCHGRIIIFCRCGLISWRFVLSWTT